MLNLAEIAESQFEPLRARRMRVARCDLRLAPGRILASVAAPKKNVSPALCCFMLNYAEFSFPPARMARRLLTSLRHFVDAESPGPRLEVNSRHRGRGQGRGAPPFFLPLQPSHLFSVSGVLEGGEGTNHRDTEAPRPHRGRNGRYPRAAGKRAMMGRGDLAVVEGGAGMRASTDLGMLQGQRAPTQENDRGNAPRFCRVRLGR